MSTQQIRNPDILSKLRQELDANIPADAGLPSVEQIKLPYLNMVLKETLRMHGPGFGTFRYCAQDTDVEGVVLPANTPLALWNPQGKYPSSVTSRGAISNCTP